MTIGGCCSIEVTLLFFSNFYHGFSGLTLVELMRRWEVLVSSMKEKKNMWGLMNTNTMQNMSLSTNSSLNKYIPQNASRYQ
jgi:hypothetical protein